MWPQKLASISVTTTCERDYDLEADYDLDADDEDNHEIPSLQIVVDVIGRLGSLSCIKLFLLMGFSTGAIDLGPLQRLQHLSYLSWYGELEPSQLCDIKQMGSLEKFHWLGKTPPS